MPTYEYRCETCGRTFDLFQSITARPLRKTKCPACGTVQRVRRLIGAGGAIIFKGSGFYQTDYRSESYRKSAKSETEPSIGSSDVKKDAGKSDATPASATASAASSTSNVSADASARKESATKTSGSANDNKKKLATAGAN